MNPTPTPSPALNRRHFLATASAATASLSILPAPLVRAATANTRIDLGLIGCGGRGKWIADLFKQDGRFNVAAVADYFPERADDAGNALGVPANRRFSGLHGYRRLLEQPLDAVAIETPPWFHPEQTAAAVQAGKHVYLAKPVAVDVPGCQSIETSGRKASANKQVLFVDFQTRANAAYQEAVRRVRDGQIGRLVAVESLYLCPLYFQNMDAEFRKAANPKSGEARLRAWAIDRVLSGDVITEQNIHTLDVATWFIDAAPVKAWGTGGRARDFLGDCWDHFSVVYQFPGDVSVSFFSKQFGLMDDIMCRVHGLTGSVETHYAGKISLRSKEEAFEGDSRNLYVDGVKTNIASFHAAITQGDFSNPTVAPSVRSNLTTILGRTAAYRGGEVTWDDMMRRAEKWDFDTRGMKT